MTVNGKLRLRSAPQIAVVQGSVVAFDETTSVTMSTSVSNNQWILDQLVEVPPRTWAGINRPGGHGKIIAVHREGEVITSVDVKYVLGGYDHGLDPKLVKSSDVLGRRSRRQRSPAKSHEKVKRKRAKKHSKKVSTPPRTPEAPRTIPCEIVVLMSSPMSDVRQLSAHAEDHPSMPDLDDTSEMSEEHIIHPPPSVHRSPISNTKSLFVGDNLPALRDSTNESSRLENHIKKKREVASVYVAEVLGGSGQTPDPADDGSLVVTESPRQALLLQTLSELLVLHDGCIGEQEALSLILDRQLEEPFEVEEFGRLLKNLHESCKIYQCDGQIYSM